MNKPENRVEELLDELVRLLALQLRKGPDSKGLISELYEAGFKPKRIAELLNTNPNAVRVNVHYAKHNKKKK